MKKDFLLFLFLCIINCSGLAQLQQVYSFQKDDTILRKKYGEESIKKKEAFLTSITKDYREDYKKIYEEQFKEISTLWKSTRPVTSPEASSYILSVAKKIISANDELKQTDARIIFSRDWWPNAFSTGEGTIAVNAGLMVYLDNEAELAFVLSHEFAHYYLQHMQKAIKKYVETIITGTIPCSILNVRFSQLFTGFSKKTSSHYRCACACHESKSCICNGYVSMVPK